MDIRDLKVFPYNSLQGIKQIEVSVSAKLLTSNQSGLSRLVRGDVIKIYFYPVKLKKFYSILAKAYETISDRQVYCKSFKLTNEY